MGSREAAMLLIALNAADSPRSAPQAIKAFSQLRLNPYPDGPRDPLAGVLEGKPFGEALAAFIEHLPILIKELLAEPADAKTRARLRGYPLSLVVAFERPFRNAEIIFRYRERDFFGWWSDASHGEIRHFRRTRVEVCSPSLVAISKVLAPKAWAEMSPCDAEGTGVPRLPREAFR
jgi:hypothetical protein